MPWLLVRDRRIKPSRGDLYGSLSQMYQVVIPLWLARDWVGGYEDRFYDRVGTCSVGVVVDAETKQIPCLKDLGGGIVGTVSSFDPIHNVLC